MASPSYQEWKALLRPPCSVHSRIANAYWIVIETAREAGGQKGPVCRFSIAMMAFLRLRPGELVKASVRDVDTRQLTIHIANPKGKGHYGKEATMPIPDVPRPYVLEYLVEREKMLKS